MRLETLAVMVLFFTNGHAQKLSSTYLGKTDFQALLTAVPEIPNDCREAFGYTYYSELHKESDKLKKRFEPFHNQMDHAQSQMEQAFSAKYNAMMNDKGDDQLQKDVKRQVNKNEVVANMGGVDAIQGMNDTQRRQAAKNAAAKSVSGGAMSMFSEAEVKKMMDDPAYAEQMAKKLNSMSEQEKIAFVQGRLNEHPMDSMTPDEMEENHQEFEQQLKDRQKVTSLMKFNTFSGETGQRLSKLIEAYRGERQRIANKAGSHIELDEQFEIDYKKIPIVVVGEGRDHDPVKVQQLRVAYASKHRDRAQKELKELLVSYHDVVAGIHQVISEYDQFLDENKWAIKATYENTLNGTNPEFALIQVEQAIGTAIAEVGKISYEETAQAASYEFDLRYKQSE